MQGTGNKFYIILLISAVWILSLYLMRPSHDAAVSSTTKASVEQIIEKPAEKHVGTGLGTDLIVSAPQGEHTIEEAGVLHAKKPQVGKIKAVFVVLVRNKELEKWLNSMRELEDRFNREYNYPYLFLNEQDFTDEFKQRVHSHTKAKVQFGKIPKEHWGYPDFIDQEKARKHREDSKGKFEYGDSESYRHMCRFESGFFFRHPMLAEYDYYWRVEPDVHFACDINFDPFEYMHNNNKKYGFTITMHENHNTIPTLWKTVHKYIKEKDLVKTLPKHNSAWFISDADGVNYKDVETGYNGCHFWTNFEIASLSLWRDQNYLDFFEYLDKSGGFFYERWGDAPVHSIYVSYFLEKNQVHFFDEIGYTHDGLTHCPSAKALRQKNCHCDLSKSMDKEGYSCSGRWLENLEK
jgi:alpha 1,2-mannosyltransferase